MAQTGLEKSIAYYQQAEEIDALINSDDTDAKVRGVKEFNKLQAYQQMNFVRDFPETTTRMIWLLLGYFRHMERVK